MTLRKGLRFVFFLLIPLAFFTVREITRATSNDQRPHSNRSISGTKQTITKLPQVIAEPEFSEIVNPSLPYSSTIEFPAKKLKHSPRSSRFNEEVLGYLSRRGHYLFSFRNDMEGVLLRSHSYFFAAQTYQDIPIEDAGAWIIVKHLPDGSQISRVEQRNLAIPEGTHFVRKISPDQAVKLAQRAMGISSLDIEKSPFWKNQEHIRRINNKYVYVQEIQYAGSPLMAQVDLRSGEVWTKTVLHSFGGGRRNHHPAPPPPPAPSPAPAPAPPPPAPTPTPPPPPPSDTYSLVLSLRGYGYAKDVSDSATPSVLSLPYTKVKYSGNANARYSDSEGDITLRGSAPDFSYSFGVEGKYSVVKNAAGSTLTKSESRSESDLPLEVLLNSTNSVESNYAQVTTFHHVARIHDWLIAHGLRNPDFDRAVTSHVNRLKWQNETLTCNALYYGSELSFFQPDSSCRNSAMQTVIYHEYGHLVDDAYGGIQDSGLSEGWGDVIASLAANESVIGDGFFKDGSPIRNASNTYQFPESGWEWDPHVLGQAWAGFAWDLKELLGTELTAELVLGSFVSNARDIPSAVSEVYVRDDDDGDLSNGTPHEEAIRTAARNHSLEGFVSDKL